MPVIPIRTESDTYRPPRANVLLVAINFLTFVLLNERTVGPAVAAFKSTYLVLHSTEPTLHQFLTYQLLHADVWHLLGNMLFLWVFGNGVNVKMGDVPYVFFYFGGGIFAAWGNAIVSPEPFTLVGASGAIAAVTAAYLALYPRARVTLLVWFFFIHFFDVSAMLLIIVKIIVWDNLVSPGLGGADRVAYSAHLAGYLFGFVGAMGMLFLRALPRDQFDMLALWKRWHQRREFATAMADPQAAARAQFGPVARVATRDSAEREREDAHIDRISELRTRIADQLEGQDLDGALANYDDLLRHDSQQCLSQRHQLAVARELFNRGDFARAAGAFERYLLGYPNSEESPNISLLVGIIFARDLHHPESADRHLTQALEALHDAQRRAQCLDWLREVRAVLGRPAPPAADLST